MSTSSTSSLPPSLLARHHAPDSSDTGFAMRDLVMALTISYLRKTRHHEHHPQSPCASSPGQTPLPVGRAQAERADEPKGFLQPQSLPSGDVCKSRGRTIYTKSAPPETGVSPVLAEIAKMNALEAQLYREHMETLLRQLNLEDMRLEAKEFQNFLELASYGPPRGPPTAGLLDDACDTYSWMGEAEEDTPEDIYHAEEMFDMFVNPEALL